VFLTIQIYGIKATWCAFVATKLA